VTENPSGPNPSTPDGAPQPPSYSAPAPGAYGTPPAYSTPPGYGAPPAPGADLSGYQVAPGTGAGPVGSVSASDERMWALFAHLGGVLVSFIVPLVIFLLYKDRSAFLRDQAAEALNWQITLAIGYLISFILVFVLIGLLLLPVLAICSLVFGIIGAIAANRGERYRYPFAVRLVH
jgi:hypothetical protein